MNETNAVVGAAIFANMIVAADTEKAEQLGLALSGMLKGHQNDVTLLALCGVIAERAAAFHETIPHDCSDEIGPEVVVHALSAVVQHMLARTKGGASCH